MKQEIKFRHGSVQEMGTRAEDTPQARGYHNGAWHAGDEKLFNAPKSKGAAGQGLMPYITALAIGAGGGGFGGSLLHQGITPAQMQAHIDRLLDKVERLEERINDRIDEVEKDLDDIDRKIDDMDHEHHPALGDYQTGGAKGSWREWYDKEGSKR